MSRKTLQSQIDAGEALCILRSTTIKNSEKALELIKVAQSDTNADLECEAVQNVDLAKIRSKIFNLMKAAEEVEVEHKKIEGTRNKLGYQDPVTSKLFTTADTRR